MQANVLSIHNPSEKSYMNIPAIALASLVLAVSASPALSGQTTQRLSATKANDYGVVYTLPSTAIDVTFEIEKITRTHGEFYKYAKRILNVNDPIVEDSEEYSLKSIVLSTHGVPNPDERYLVKFSPGSSIFMLLNDSDIPLAINTERIYEPEKPKLPEAVEPEPSPLQSPAARQVITAEMLQSQSSLKRAQLAAEQLYALRQSRSDLLTGQADQMPPDGQAMKIIMDNINAQEAALTAMFVGTEQSSTEVITISVLPGDSDFTDRVIARISPIEGLVSADDLSGVPVYMSYNIKSRGEYPVNEKGVQLTFPKNGLAYCIPGTAEITVSFEGNEEASATFDIAQAGIVYGLNPGSFTHKREPLYLILDPATGAAIEIGAAPVSK